MDFVDFDSFAEAAAPQPAMSLPLASLPKMPNLADFRNILKFEAASEPVSDDVAEKYARMSLDLVAAPAAEPAGAYSLSHKLAKVLNGGMSDSLTRDIFANLHATYTDNLTDPGVVGSIKRKNLRSRIERNLIKTQAQVLKEYAPAVRQLKSVGARIRALDELNRLNNADLAQVLADLERFHTEFKALNTDKTAINLHKNLLMTFKNRFALNEFEEFTLNNNELNTDFCKVLLKLDEINANSAILLSIDNSSLGVKIMQKLSKLSARANETLFSFCKRSLYNVQFVNNTEKLYRFHLYFKIFHKRSQSSFTELIGDFVTERSTILIEDFLDQFNAGITSTPDVARPIIMNVHDPSRFIGDLLAHIHALVINELELINSIFIITDDELAKKADVDDDLFSLTAVDQQIFVKISHQVSDKIFEKLAKNIRAKFEQLISIESKIKNVYTLFNILELYQLMFQKLLHSGSMMDTVDTLIKFCQTKILDLVDSNLKSIQNSNSARLDINSDLQPPEWIVEFYSGILPIVEQSKMSFDSLFNYTDDQSRQFQQKIINRPIEIFKEHIQASQQFDKRESIILELNFVDQILTRILPINLLNDKILELDQEVATLKKALVDIELNQLLRDCNLYDYYNVINMIVPLTDDFFDLSIYEPLTENKLFNKDGIEQCNSVLSEFIPGASDELESRLMKVNNPLVVNDVTEHSLVELVKFYLKFDMLVQHYLKQKLVWTDVEVATLLGIDEVYTQIKPQLSMDS